MEADINKITTIDQLRRVLPSRGRDFYDILLPEDFATHNAEACYCVRHQPDGCVDVTMHERGELLFHQVYPDEAVAVADLDARLPLLVFGPPSTPEQIRWSMDLGEQTRRRLLAKRRPPEGGLGQ